MNFPKKSAAIGAAAVTAPAAGGFALGGPTLAAYALLSSASIVAIGLLWLQIGRAGRAQAASAAAIEERVATLAKRVQRLQEAQEGGVSELIEQADQTRRRLRQIPADTRRLVQDDDRTDELVRRLDAMAAQLDDLPRQHRRLVREWSRVVYGEIADLTALYQDIRPDRALPALHGWATAADLARFLYQEVVGGRTNVLECGSGSTTVILAYAARAKGEGRITALEHEPKFAEATREMLRERGLSEWAQVIDAPLVDVELDGATWRWYDTSPLPEDPIDLFLVDGPPASVGPEARYPALPVLHDRLAANALVVLDDTRRPDERAIGERWQREFGEFTLESLPHDHGTFLFSRRNTPAEDYPRLEGPGA